MIYFTFVWNKPIEMIAWCKENVIGCKFSENFLHAKTGVWLNEEDAIAFRLKFGVSGQDLKVFLPPSQEET